VRVKSLKACSKEKQVYFPALLWRDTSRPSGRTHARQPAHTHTHTHPSHPYTHTQPSHTHTHTHATSSVKRKLRSTLFCGETPVSECFRDQSRPIVSNSVAYCATLHIHTRFTFTHDSHSHTLHIHTRFTSTHASHPHTLHIHTRYTFTHDTHSHTLHIHTRNYLFE
jgi:hypothetical protein